MNRRNNTTKKIGTIPTSILVQNPTYCGSVVKGISASLKTAAMS
jgi:hypothetical protein